jgi:hypothetical protein
MRNNVIKPIFDKEAELIRCYPAITTVTDTLHGTKTVTYLNPITIKALVSDLTMAKVQWALPGVTTSKVKQIIIEAKNENLFQNAYKIEIDNENYIGWKEKGKDQSRKVADDYIKAYIYIEA